MSWTFVTVQLKHHKIPSVVKVGTPPTCCPLHTQNGTEILFTNCNCVVIVSKWKKTYTNTKWKRNCGAPSWICLRPKKSLNPPLNRLFTNTTQYVKCNSIIPVQTPTTNCPKMLQWRKERNIKRKGEDYVISCNRLLPLWHMIGEVWKIVLTDDTQTQWKVEFALASETTDSQHLYNTHIFENPNVHRHYQQQSGRHVCYSDLLCILSALRQLQTMRHTCAH